MSQQKGHDWSKLAAQQHKDKDTTQSSGGCPVEDTDVDLVEQMIQKTGCMEHHYAVAECMADTQDWRKCQTQVTDFRICMDAYQRQQSKSHRDERDKQ